MIHHRRKTRVRRLREPRIRRRQRDRSLRQELNPFMLLVKPNHRLPFRIRPILPRMHLHHLHRPIRRRHLQRILNPIARINVIRIRLQRNRRPSVQAHENKRGERNTDAIHCFNNMFSLP